MSVLSLGQILVLLLFQDAESQSTFYYENITCDYERDCTVNCFIRWACNRATVYGPKGAALTVNCNSKQKQHSELVDAKSCARMVIHAENSISLHINVANSYDDVEIIKTQIYTPTVNTINTYNIITCGIFSQYSFADSVDKPQYGEKHDCDNNDIL